MSNPIECIGCKRSYHQTLNCSGLKNRYQVQAARPTWKCKQCLHPHDRQQTPSQPNPRSHSPRPRCYSCKARTAPGYLECKTCGAATHQKVKCSGLDTRGALESAKRNKDWVCRTCVVRSRPPDDAPSSTGDITQKSELKTGKPLRRPLRIVQWNAEGVNTKAGELRGFIEEYKIDVVLIQESKLTEKKASPVIQGFSAVRGDRKGAVFPGGGLLTYVSEELTFRNNGHSQRGLVELLSVSIQQTGKKWLTLNNLYIPPGVGVTDLSWIPVVTNSVFAGDFNGHSPAWDLLQPPDTRGEQILDWSLDNSLECVNDTAPTRLNPGTSGWSTPDITFVTPELTTKTKWAVIEETAMGSDHQPIVVEVSAGDFQTISTTPLRTRWKTKSVDYKAFREEVESHFPYDHSHLSCHGRAAVFGDILVEAGKAHVGKTKPSKTKFAMNPTVRTLVKKRNRLRKEVATRRDEWIAARQEVREERERAKVEAWSDFVETLEVDEDVNKVWRVIKSLDGTPTSSAPNEALLHKGKTITSNKAKADTFAKNYAQVSSLSFSKDERSAIRDVKKSLDKQPGEHTCPPFTMRELKTALRKMKRKGAPGSDDIPPAFLKELGPKALTELLEIFNYSFLNADIPQFWRHAFIIPILKAGKPACDVDSFRPISLTSCVVKLLERMISNRLNAIAENSKWFVNEQAGFRRGLSCEDQIIRLVQKVSDGFQLKPPLRTVMALLDYSKAYDRTWRERLLAKMLDMGVPITITRWVAAFLRTRTAQVLMNGTLSSKVRMKQGLPQGSVLSPLLFIIFINDLVKDLPEEVTASLFADDAALYAQHTDLSIAEEKLQEAITVVENWSLENKLDLNTKKSCTFFFSTDPHEASWRPNINLLGSRMPFGEGEEEKKPKFLGVRLDRTLCFQDHVMEVCERVTKRCRMLSCLASRAWGWRKRSLRRVFITCQRSILDYAAPAWQPSLSPSQFEHLERTQNRSLRAITGQYANTSVELLRLEAGVPSYRTHSNRLIASAYEKGKRLPTAHPRFEALHPRTTVEHRSSRDSFRRRGEDLTNELSISGAPREPIDLSLPEPWNEPERNWTVHTNMDIKKDIAAIKLRVQNIGAELNIYTDGSCTGGVLNGGAAAVVTTGEFDDPAVIEAVEAKGEHHTSSYKEEMRALGLGIGWLETHPRRHHCAFLTDSLSLLQAMENDQLDTASIRARLQQACDKIDLLYVPGHRDIPGNELADLHAKSAAALDQPFASEAISYQTARSTIKAEIKDAPTTHRIGSQFYHLVSQERDDKETKTRKQGAVLGQLRAGHHKCLSYYKHMVDDEVTDKCERCELGEVDDTEHWFTRCAQTAAARQEIFGTHNVCMAELGLAPGKTIKLAEKTLDLQ